MHQVGCQIRGLSVFWCPRCGTVKRNEIVEIPKLVPRVVEFCGTLDEDNEQQINDLIRLGVTESVTHPDVTC